MNDSIFLQGFKFSNSDAGRWELTKTDLEYVSCRTLFKLFHKELWWYPHPVGWGRRISNFGYRKDFIVALWAKNFRIEIEKGLNLLGPHAARLYYKSRQIEEETAWIATCQLEFMWWSDPKAEAALMDAIWTRQLFQSEKSGQVLVLK